MSGLSGKAPTPPPTAASATPAKQWTGSMAEKPAAATESKEQTASEIKDSLLNMPEIKAERETRDHEIAIRELAKQVKAEKDPKKKRTLEQQLERFKDPKTGVTTATMGAY